jgi:hypothetical protein
MARKECTKLIVFVDGPVIVESGGFRREDHELTEGGRSRQDILQLVQRRFLRPPFHHVRYSARGHTVQHFLRTTFWDGTHTCQSATWLHKARQMPKAEFQREVEKELTGKDSEPSELIYFKVYKSQVPVIERAIETAALMLGSEKYRGYCLEMICADFLAGASIDGSNPEILLQSISRYYKFLPGAQQEAFLSEVNQSAS